MANTTLDTVADYIADARVLLQDTIVEYRYSDASLLTALNLALMDARRMRADLFMDSFWNTWTAFTAVDTTDVPMEYQFRLAFGYGLCAHAFARDQEDVQDERSAAFLQNYNAILLGVARPGLQRRAPK